MLKQGHRWFWGVATLLLAGCVIQDTGWRRTPVHPDRSSPPVDAPPPLAHCTDTVGHDARSHPFIFGGSCCCTPTVAVMEAYHRNGTLVDWGVDALVAAHRARGIALSGDHESCNNLCRQGPHVVKGGRCLVPPTPVTPNHEEVLSGRFTLTPWERRQLERLGGPLAIEPR